MKDVILDKRWKKTIYYLCWIPFILGFGWVPLLFLFNYGRKTDWDTEKKKGVLNLTYQKFIWVYGIILWSLVILIWVIVIFLSIFFPEW